MIGTSNEGRAMLTRIGFAVLLSTALHAALPAHAETVGAPLAHAPFDANDCLKAIRPSPAESSVEFHWGCPKKKLVTMSCIFDRAGYQGLGPDFARPGWHCNYPLPVLTDQNGRRVSDVAVGDVRGRAVWAACAVTDLGDFAVPSKPYHSSACYRLMMRIKSVVNRTGRDPAAVAAEVIP